MADTFISKWNSLNLIKVTLYNGRHLLGKTRKTEYEYF